MSSVQVTSNVDLEQVIQGMSELDNSELESVLSRLSLLLASRKAGRLPTREMQLLKRVNQGLSAEQQSYYSQLRDGLQSESLSEKEHQDWLELTEQSELIDAERLKALTELAALRGVSLEVVMQQLGIVKPLPYV